MLCPKRRVLGALLVALGFLSSVRGQEPKLLRLSAAQELPHSTIYAFAQDSRGFMWIGTQYGLCRYDGYRLKIYLSDPAEPGSLSSNQIMALIVDREETLWVGTLNGGLCRYDEARDRFVRYIHDPADERSLSHNDVMFLCEDRRGTLWVGTTHGLNALDSDRRRFRAFRHDPRKPDSLSHDRVQCIREDKNGLIWVGTADGLNLIGGEQRVFERFRFERTAASGMDPNNVVDIYENKSGDLLVGTLSGMFRFDRKKRAFSAVSASSGGEERLENEQVWSMQEDNAGTTWLAGDRGLLALDYESRKFSRFQADIRKPDSLLHNSVTKLFLDRTGILWVGTLRGVNLISSFQSDFELWQNVPGQSQSPSGNDINALCEDRQGILWIGTNEGLDRLDRRNMRFTHFRHDPRLASSLSAGRVRSILEDGRGRLWVATYGGGLNLFDREKETFAHLASRSGSSPGLEGTSVIFLFGDRRGSVWVGTTEGGLTRVDPPGRPGEPFRFTAFRARPEDPKWLSSDRVVAMLEDRRGALWMATDGGGLNEFHPDKAEFRRHTFDAGDPQSLSSNNILSLLEDSAGTIWAGSRGGGLNRLDPLTGLCRRYGTAQGLPSDIVIGILEDVSGRLWLSTNRGLAEFDPPTGNVIVYKQEDGLQGDHFTLGANLKTRDGELFFGGSRGLNIIRPGRLRRNPHPPPVVITDLTLSRRTIGPEGLPVSLFPLVERGAVRLAYGDRFFAVEFSALDFNNPSKNQYAWILEGRDKDWTYLGHTHRIVCNDLRPGKYRLRVRGSNNSGIWNEEGAGLDIIVLPPWWRTWPFILSSAALLGSAVWAAIVLRRRYRYAKDGRRVNLEHFCSLNGISPRECDIIRLILEGRSYQEIASGLFISLKTVKSHVYHIYQKLGVKNRIQMANLVSSHPAPSGQPAARETGPRTR